MSAHHHVKDILQFILGAVAKEAGVLQDSLSVEVETVISNGVMEAFKRGESYAHDRPTEPPHRPSSSKGMRAVRLPTPQPIPVVTSQQPRVPVKRDPRREG